MARVRTVLLAALLAACSSEGGLDEPTPEPTPPRGDAGRAPDDVTHDDAGVTETFSLGGHVTGLVGGAVHLANNGAGELAIVADGPFTFETRIAAGSAYAVTVARQPETQRCDVANGTGAAVGDVSDVEVTCAASYAVGGTATGVDGTLELDNGGDRVTVGPDGAFVFPRRLVEGEPYEVTVASAPAGQVCTVTDGSGTIGAEDVTMVSVACRHLAVAIDEVYARPSTGALGDANGDGVRDGSHDEFVEIINNEAFAVDLGGWTIRTGAAATTVKITFPKGTELAAGARAVVFGGGTPTGSFGGARTFTGDKSLALSDGGYTVVLAASATTPELDTVTYDGAAFGTSCTTCASLTRQPSGTGAFVKHDVASGSAGVLASPGAAPQEAIPKLHPAFAQPAQGAPASVLSTIKIPFNMFMRTADFDPANIKLYASSCAAKAMEVTSFASFGPDAASAIGDAIALLVPSAPLGFATTYCVHVDGGVRSALDVPLGAPVEWSFSTRAAASAPAATVVISQYGGCRLNGSGTGASPCGSGTFGANDEFVELHNPTAAAVDVSGWFLQRRTAAGSSGCAATLPANATIPAGGYYLIGGAGYDAAHYADAPGADHVAGGSLITGTGESLVLGSAGASCTNLSAVADAVSVGAITDTYAHLRLPALPATVDNGAAVARKACYDSTADASTTGILAGGGHAAQGNAERFGESQADWLVRPTPAPKNTGSAPQTRTCP